MTFPVSPGATGRWLRIVSLPRKNPDEGSDEVQIMNIHAYGARLAPTPTPQVTGTYDSDLGVINLTQNGAQVTGCGEKATKPLLGVLEGRVLRFQWERDAQNDHGPMVMVFGDQGRVFGAYWNETVEQPTLLAFNPERTSTKAGACPNPALRIQSRRSSHRRAACGCTASTSIPTRTRCAPNRSRHSITWSRC